jgi:hypothetical protein
MRHPESTNGASISRPPGDATPDATDRRNDGMNRHAAGARRTRDFAYDPCSTVREGNSMTRGIALATVLATATAFAGTAFAPPRPTARSTKKRERE